jgi:hypothetical protein
MTVASWIQASFFRPTVGALVTSLGGKCDLPFARSFCTFCAIFRSRVDAHSHTHLFVSLILDQHSRGDFVFFPLASRRVDFIYLLSDFLKPPPSLTICQVTNKP